MSNKYYTNRVFNNDIFECYVKEMIWSGEMRYGKNTSPKKLKATMIHLYFKKEKPNIQKLQLDGMYIRVDMETEFHIQDISGQTVFDSSVDKNEDFAMLAYAATDDGINLTYIDKDKNSTFFFSLPKDPRSGIETTHPRFSSIYSIYLILASLLGKNYEQNLAFNMRIENIMENL